MTIYEVKADSIENQPFFFSRNTLKAFGQTLRSFSVRKVEDRIYRVSAPMKYQGKVCGETVRFFCRDNLFKTIEQARARRDA